MSKPHLLDALRDAVLLCDGAMGSRVQGMTLDVERDYQGRENCTDVLNISRPDLVRDIHRGYFEAGADMVETNTFGGSPVTLAEFDLADRAFEINRRGAELAREAADQFSDGRHRWVIGSVGPGTKLPSLGNIAYDPLEAALADQCRGLLAGGVDAILIETCQDPLQIKAAVNGAKIARAEAGSDIPIFVQATVETTGTLLVGPDVAAAAAIVNALDVPMIGLNCATGPQEMAEHIALAVQQLARAAVGPAERRIARTGRWPAALSAQRRRPRDLAGTLRRRGQGQPDRRLLRHQHTAYRRARCDAAARAATRRPTPVVRKSVWIPSVASMYQSVPLRQENAFFAIGERCNANGSKKWREAQEKHDWDGCVAMGREQIGEGSNALDVCTAFVGRDENAEMTEVIRRFTASVNSPLVIDSTETPVIEAALKLHGGKPIINSINFEDGEKAADDRLKLAKQFGAAVIALTIDEVGMAKTAEDKLASPAGWLISPVTSMACRNRIC